MKNEKINTHAVQLIGDDFLAAVKKNAYALQYVNKDWISNNSDKYKEVALVAVKKNAYALQYVNKDWISKNSDQYKEVALVAIQNVYDLEFVNKVLVWALEHPIWYKEFALAAAKKNGLALAHVNQNWAVANSQWYHDIVLAAVKQNGWALGDVNEEWAVANPQWYHEIALAAAKKNGLALAHVNQNWAEKNSEKYYNIVLAAVKQNGRVLQYVNENWAVANSQWYHDIVLAAVKQNGMALQFAGPELKKDERIVEAAVKEDGRALQFAGPELKKDERIVEAAVKEDGRALEYVNEDLKDNSKIVLAALSENGSAFRYAGQVFRNDIKIAISSLMGLKLYGFGLFYYIDEMLSSPCEPSENILLYLYMLSNKNVSNEFKNALFEIFRAKFDQFSDKFTLYKNILECYLFLSQDYTEEFEDDELLANLTNDDSKQLHMFLSLADPSALKNDKLAKFLNNDHNDYNDIIKNYLTKDTHNLKSIKNFNIYSSLFKSIKNFNIYSSLLPKNLFVINYDKIINMMKNTTLNTTLMNKMKNDNLIKLILCYSGIEDSLKLSEALKLGDKLQVKYLDIVPKFEREGVDISTGIEAFVDAITSENGYLSNVINYDKMIKMMKDTPLMNNKMKNDNLIKLILRYSRIEDLLALSEGLDLGDKLEVKYLDIVPKFEREYDTCSTIYSLLDIELSQHNN